MVDKANIQRVDSVDFDERKDTANITSNRTSKQKKVDSTANMDVVKLRNDRVIPIPRNAFITKALSNNANGKRCDYIGKESPLTNAEKKLYKIMLQAFNSRLRVINKSITIFPCVRLADFLDLAPNHRKKALYNIACKHIDYLVCDSETLDIVFAVELDDDYHNKADRVIRDRFVENTLSECGIKLFRVKEKIDFVDETTISGLIDYLLEVYAPICPLCGSPTTLKKSSYRKNFGHRFYGCTKWRTKNHCSYNLSIE